MWNDILQEIARRGDVPEPTAGLLRQIWPALVGDSIARLSSPLRLEERTLVVEARNQTLVEEWTGMPGPLLDRVNGLAPWPVENLQVEHNPEAGVLPPNDSSASGEDKRASLSPDGSAPIDRKTDDAIDAELRELIESIDRHRRQKDE